MKRKLIAYHEAGHAIMDLDVHKKFRWVSIVPDDHSRGKVIQLPTKIEYDPSYVPRNRSKIEDFVQVLMAGEAAVCILKERKHKNGYWKDRYPGTDYHGIIEWLEHLCWHPDEYDHYFSILWTRTLLRLCKPHRWWGVERLADALLERKTLTYSEVTELCQIVPGEKTWSDFERWLDERETKKEDYMSQTVPAETLQRAKEAMFSSI